MVGWLAVIGILLLFTAALTWVAVIAGLTAKTVDGASAFSYPLIFLPLISSAFMPTDSMPAPVAWFAQNQPVTPIVETIRALFAGTPVSGQIWVALAWLLGILVAGEVRRGANQSPSTPALTPASASAAARCSGVSRRRCAFDGRIAGTSPTIGTGVRYRCTP